MSALKKIATLATVVLVAASCGGRELPVGEAEQGVSSPIQAPQSHSQTINNAFCNPNDAWMIGTTLWPRCVIARPPHTHWCVPNGSGLPTLALGEAAVVLSTQGWDGAVGTDFGYHSNCLVVERNVTLDLWWFQTAGWHAYFGAAPYPSAPNHQSYPYVYPYEVLLGPLTTVYTSNSSVAQSGNTNEAFTYTSATAGTSSQWFLLPPATSGQVANSIATVDWTN